MRSELPEVARTRHHWVVLFRLPRPLAGICLILLIAWAWVEPAVSIVVIVIILAAAFLRWQTWRAEQMILTRKRIIRVQGVPETTRTEAFLRIDRISGIRMVQTVPGKLLDYATIELEAPGNHPDVRRMVKIWHPNEFYRELRELVFIEAQRHPDPDDIGAPEGNPDYTTQPLPRMDPPTLRT
jgi:hypothetical protein